MSLVAYALTNLSRQKVFMDINVATHDTRLTNLINSATDFIENFCDRRFKKTAYTQELYDGNGSSKLLLKQYPVVSGETFTLQKRGAALNEDNWSSIESENFFVKESQGIVDYISSIFARLPQHYRITYTAGLDFDAAGDVAFLDEVGAGDLEYGIWKLVSKLFNKQASGDVSSERIGNYSISFRKEVLADQEIREILLKHKRPYEH